MKKVFIIHGFRGEPNGGWRPWLMRELAKKDIYACALPMPNPYNPIKSEWIDTIKKVVDHSEDEIYLIGHSLGVPAILRYLETLSPNIKINGAVLVSGPISYVDLEGGESVNKFLEGYFNFEHIRNVCKNFTVIHGTDDPLVPFSDAEKLSKELNCNLVSILNGKHLNGSAGFFEVVEVLDSLTKMFL